MFKNVSKEVAEKIVEELEKSKDCLTYFEVGINDVSGFHFSWYSSADIAFVLKIIAEKFPELKTLSIDEIFDVTWMQR